jgi:hypothetical protein
MRVVTDASIISPCKKRTGNTAIGYLRQASVRREQRDMTAEDWNNGTRRRKPVLGSGMVNMCLLWQW